MKQPGNAMYALLKTLFPICRSITGDGVRKTLSIIQKTVPLVVHEVPSGTKVFDWTVPEEWNIRDAYVKDQSGKKVIDFKRSNLHIVNYSVPFKGKVPLEELKEHLHTLPDQPDLVPYVTSYYQRRWGFCVAYKDLKKFKKGTYEVAVDSTLKPGSLTYGELIIEGQSDQEVLVSTYICHPSLANNELSGPVLSAFLARHILDKKVKPYYTYRFVFIPETIGAITYISRHLEHLRKKVIAGYVVTCCGDPGDFSYLQSRNGNALVDRVTMHVLKHSCRSFKTYDYTQRGSDERQYCAPGVDLPVGVLMRRKFGTYPCYHTSGDDLDFVTPQGLEGSLRVYKLCMDVLEQNHAYVNQVLCEPQLGKRGLYPNLGTASSGALVRQMMGILAYSDGEHDLVSIAEKYGVPAWTLFPIAEKLCQHGLIGRKGS